MRHILQVRIRVSNLEDSITFYEAALEPLGLRRVVDHPDGLAVGFGIKRICKARTFLWLIAPGAPMSLDGLSVERRCDADVTSDTLPLLGAQSFDMLEKGGEPQAGDGGVTRNVHVFLPAFKRASVDQFYERAVAAGGRGILPAACRPSPYNGKWYYNAVVQDLEGRSIEVACGSPPFVSGKYGWIVKKVFLVVVFVHMYILLKRLYGQV